MSNTTNVTSCIPPNIFHLYTQCVPQPEPRYYVFNAIVLLGYGFILIRALSIFLNFKTPPNAEEKNDSSDKRKSKAEPKTEPSKYGFSSLKSQGLLFLTTTVAIIDVVLTMTLYRTSIPAKVSICLWVSLAMGASDLGTANFFSFFGFLRRVFFLAVLIVLTTGVIPIRTDLNDICVYLAAILPLVWVHLSNIKRATWDSPADTRHLDFNAAYVTCVGFAAAFVVILACLTKSYLTAAIVFSLFQLIATSGLIS